MSELTDEQWKVAHAIAEKMAPYAEKDSQKRGEKGSKASELKKAMAYLRTCVNEPDSSQRLFKYLKYTEGTPDECKGLNKVDLNSVQDNPKVMLEVLGWAGRLIGYYKGMPIAEIMIGEPTIDLAAEKRAMILKAAAVAGYEVGQRLTVMITGIKGKEVTYAVSEQIKLTQKIKILEGLALGQSVQVEITEMRDTGVPKKVKLVT